MGSLSVTFVRRVSGWTLQGVSVKLVLRFHSLVSNEFRKQDEPTPKEEDVYAPFTLTVVGCIDGSW